AADGGRLRLHTLYRPDVAARHYRPIHPQIHLSRWICAGALRDIRRYRTLRVVVRRYGSAASALSLHVDTLARAFCQEPKQGGSRLRRALLSDVGIPSSSRRARISARVAHGISIAAIDPARCSADHSRFYGRRRTVSLRERSRLKG